MSIYLGALQPQLVAMLTEETTKVAGLSEGNHTLEWYLVWSTVGLGLATLSGMLVTMLLTWVSWKLYKVDAARSETSAKVANNSIDSMEHVAVVALTHEDRIRQMKLLRKGRGV